LQSSVTGCGKDQEEIVVRDKEHQATVLARSASNKSDLALQQMIAMGEFCSDGNHFVALHASVKASSRFARARKELGLFL
jgi:hypothetical protein